MPKIQRIGRASRAETLISQGFQAFWRKGGAQNAKNPARLARRNVDFPKDFKESCEKGVSKFPKNRRASRAGMLIFLRISSILAEMGGPTPQKPAALRAGQPEAQLAGPALKSVSSHPEKDHFFHQSTRPIPEKNPFGGS